MIPAIVVSVLATSLGQILFSLIVIYRHFYSLWVRVVVLSLLIISSAGGFWLLLSLLTGGDRVLGSALLYMAPQAGALWAIVCYRFYEILRNSVEASATRHSRQNAREEHQDQRSAAQDERDVRQSERGRQQDERGQRQDKRLD